MTGQTIGYARVSTSHQDIELQERRLREAGAERLFSDHASGAADDRPGLAELVRYARDGDTVLITKLDRLGRSLQHLLTILQQLAERGAAVRVLDQSINTDPSDPAGRLTLHVLGAVAEFERQLMRSRQQEGIAKAQAAGKFKGRVSRLDVAAILQRIEAGIPQARIARELGVNASTIHRLVKRHHKAA
jgi:DNA invertase Pin-like site-specific DNA recombinase